MDARDVKALELTGNTRICYVAGNWLVPSQSSAARHKVNPSQAAPSCTCEDFHLRGQPCKHIMAVRQLLERQLKGQPHPDPATIPMRAPRPTYGQNWPAYNKSQTHEKDHLQRLLADLCRTIADPEADKPRRGRRPIPLGDAVFAATLKVYSTFSARRFMSDQREAAERGHLSRAVPFNCLLRTLDREDVTPILTSLIQRSALPLSAVESQFSVDSSGFATSRYVKWFDEKYGCNREKARWVKAHICVGTLTQVVTAAVVDEKNSGDSPQFGPLVKATAEGFKVGEVSADKAYLSHENLAVVDSVGGTTFIPFKTNSVCTGSELWQRMYHYFAMRREEFLEHYHRRSNVESAFSMIKRKFADAVRAKGDTAMRNEVLAKILCHNLCCVISAWYELGIDPAAWAAPKAPGLHLIAADLHQNGGSI
jgi:transposase